MSEIELKVSSDGLAALSRRLGQLIDQVHHLGPFMHEAGQYMVNSTKHRIRQGWTQPDGEPLAPLSELTQILKGHDKPLFDKGELWSGIEFFDTGATEIIVTASARNERGKDYAPFVQHGVQRPTGIVKKPDGTAARPHSPIPPRPFLGFSAENIKRLSSMLRAHILKESS